MAGFAKFDPRAFLEGEERTAANKHRTLAALATLAASPSKIENQDVGYLDSTADHHCNGKSLKHVPTPAKAAKVAKVEPPATASEDVPWGDTEETRSAIAEHDGRAPRAWAEALARLDPNKPPADVPQRRWVRFIDDCGRFINQGWADRSVVLGWRPLNLFGCDRVNPFARIDRMGLLWLLNGQKILVLAADSAAIVTASGGSLMFRRCPNESGRVLAWELPHA